MNTGPTVFPKQLGVRQEEGSEEARIDGAATGAGARSFATALTRGLTGEGLSTRTVYPTIQSPVRCGSRRSGQNYARLESTSATRDYTGKTLDLTELSEHLFPSPHEPQRVFEKDGGGGWIRA